MPAEDTKGRAGAPSLRPLTTEATSAVSGRTGICDRPLRGPTEVSLQHNATGVAAHDLTESQRVAVDAEVVRNITEVHVVRHLGSHDLVGAQFGAGRLGETARAGILRTTDVAAEIAAERAIRSEMYRPGGRT